MSVVWLLRHAEARKAPGQREEDLFSVADLGLSARGLAQAEAARDALAGEPIEAVYASPLLRAQETARVVAQPRRARVVTDPRLAEIDVGGRGYEEVLANILELPSRLAAHADATRAFAAAMEDAARAHACCAVVAHGLANRAFLRPILGLAEEELLTIEVEHARPVRLRCEAGAWSM